jgi:hypothetical protein
MLLLLLFCSCCFGVDVVVDVVNAAEVVTAFFYDIKMI